MRTIAIMNNKGGVGKTVTAINLADILVHGHKKHVILADCDGQANLSRFFLPNYDDINVFTMADLLLGGGEMIWSENLTEVEPGLDLIPAASDLYWLDVAAIKAGSKDPYVVKQFTDSAAKDNGADFFVFDCPPGFTAASCAALIAADEVVIPITVDGFAFEGMADLTAQIYALRQINSNIKIAGILVNQWHNSEVVRDGERLLRSLDVPVYKQVIRRTDKVPESTFQRQPLSVYSPTSAAGRDYRAWVRELLEGGTPHVQV